MATYRLYRIRPDSHVAGPSAEISADDDRLAIKLVRSLSDAHDIEIWDEKRLVACVAAKGTGRAN